jgi:hypothetical protein
VPAPPERELTETEPPEPESPEPEPPEVDASGNESMVESFTSTTPFPDVTGERCPYSICHVESEGTPYSNVPFAGTALRWLRFVTAAGSILTTPAQPFRYWQLDT